MYSTGGGALFSPRPGNEVPPQSPEVHQGAGGSPHAWKSAGGQSGSRLKGVSVVQRVISGRSISAGMKTKWEVGGAQTGGGPWGRVSSAMNLEPPRACVHPLSVGAVSLMLCELCAHLRWRRVSRCVSCPPWRWRRWSTPRWPAPWRRSTWQPTPPSRATTWYWKSRSRAGGRTEERRGGVAAVAGVKQSVWGFNNNKKKKKTSPFSF